MVLLFFIEGRLEIEDFWHFDLRPYEIRIFFMMNLLKIKPLPHQTPYQIAIIPPPNKIFQIIRILFNIQIPINTVREVQSKQKLSKLIYLLFDNVINAIKLKLFL